MKTAEEVAVPILNRFWNIRQSDTPEEAFKFIVKAITAYAEERVKEAESKCTLRVKDHFVGFTDMVKQARAEALEEAAERLFELGEEKYPVDIFRDKSGTFARHLLQNVLPDEIRALKEKK